MNHPANDDGLFDHCPWLFAEQASDGQRAAQQQRQKRLLAGPGPVRLGADCFVAETAAVHPDVLHLGDRSYIAAHAYVTGAIRTGADCTINPFTVVRGTVTLGNGVRIGAHTSLLGFNHGFAPDLPVHQQPVTSRGITVGDDVWIGSHVVVVDGVTIGDHCVIGAGAVVTKDLPAWTVAAGNPARHIRDRREPGPPGRGAAEGFERERREPEGAGGGVESEGTGSGVASEGGASGPGDGAAPAGGPQRPAPTPGQGRGGPDHPDQPPAAPLRHAPLAPAPSPLGGPAPSPAAPAPSQAAAPAPSPAASALSQAAAPLRHAPLAPAPSPLGGPAPSPAASAPSPLGGPAPSPAASAPSQAAAPAPSPAASALSQAAAPAPTLVGAPAPSPLGGPAPSPAASAPSQAAAPAPTLAGAPTLAAQLAGFAETARVRAPELLDRCRCPDTGRYLDRPGARPTVRAHCDAVEIADLLLGDAPPDLPAAEHVARLRALQDPATGLVPEYGAAPPLPGPAGLPDDDGAAAYHVLCVGYALDVLGSSFAHPVHTVRTTTAGRLVRHLAALPWRDRAWHAGAWVDSWATAAHWNLRLGAEAAAPGALEALFGWLHTHADPWTGMWGSPTPEGGRLQMVNGYYRLTRGSFAQFALPVPYAERVIDTVLDHARDPRHFAPGRENACNVLDVIHPLWLCARQTTHRCEETRAWAANQLTAALRRWHPGQGFGFGPTPDGTGPGREPGLQGTEMWLAIIWLLADVLGLADILGYRPRGIHRPEPAPSAGNPASSPSPAEPAGAPDRCFPSPGAEGSASVR